MVDEAKQDERKKRMGVVGAARWTDRLWNFLMIFKTPGEGIAALGAAGVVAATAGLTVADAVNPAARVIKTTPAIVAVETERLDDAVIYPVVGYDNAGRRAAFDFVVLDKAFTWTKGRTDQVERSGAAIPAADIAKTVLGPQVQAALARSRSVIAVGVASQEGQAAEETERARRRAEQAAVWTKTAVPANTEVWALNLGQYRDGAAAYETTATSWQRPFMVIGVRDAQPNTNIGEALTDAMSGKSNLPSVTNYTTFDLNRVR